jgi:nucleotide-binding universal stress UspA family protein
MSAKILVPTDGSVAASVGEREAVRLAKRMKGRVVALHVIEEREGALSRLFLGLRNELLHHRQSDGVEIIERVKEQGRREGVEVEGVIRKGRPQKEILRYLSEHPGIDLIILSPRPLGFFSRLLMGSTTKELVKEIGRLVSCPILLTPPR